MEKIEAMPKRIPENFIFYNNKKINYKNARDFLIFGKIFESKIFKKNFEILSDKF